MPVFETTYAPEIAVFTPAQLARESNGATPSPTWPRSPPSTLGGLPPHRDARAPGSTLPKGATEEATLVRPVSLRQGRGARLSFLGGRKKDQKEVNSDHQPIHEEEPATPTSKPNPSHPKDSGSFGNRRSFFRTVPSTPETGTASPRAGHNGYPPLHPLQTNGIAPSANGEWPTDASGGSGSETYASMSPAVVASGGSEKDGYQPRVYETHVLAGQGQAPPPGQSIAGHVGSVRKRLSILRLGKKSSKERAAAGGLGGVDEE